jgi:hypothetical protein
LRRLGQLVPIVVCEREAAFAIVDGFKRLAAARALGLETLRARVMALGEAAAIAALVSLNRAGRGLTDLEEAWWCARCVVTRGSKQTRWRSCSGGTRAGSVAASRWSSAWPRRSRVTSRRADLEHGRA